MVLTVDEEVVAGDGVDVEATMLVVLVEVSWDAVAVCEVAEEVVEGTGLDEVEP